MAAICLRQLRRTCDSLVENGVDATAVIVACDENLDTARNLGFGTVERDNRFVSRRFNDGISLACNPSVNPRPASYVVPCGSDDFVDHRIFLDLPPANTVYGFQRMSFVREDGQEMTTRHLLYRGGCGIRIYPAAVMAAAGYRPADEDRKRACDTSILTNLTLTLGDTLKVEHRESDARSIVDWKTGGEQLNPYSTLARHRREGAAADPFVELAGFYPTAALEAMASHYGRTREMVAA